MTPFTRARIEIHEHLTLNAPLDFYEETDFSLLEPIIANFATGHATLNETLQAISTAAYTTPETDLPSNRD